MKWSRWMHKGLTLLKTSERCSLEQHSKDLIGCSLWEHYQFVSVAYNCRLPPSYIRLHWGKNLIKSVTTTSFCSPCQNYHRLDASYSYFALHSSRIIVLSSFHRLCIKQTSHYHCVITLDLTTVWNYCITLPHCYFLSLQSNPTQPC